MQETQTEIINIQIRVVKGVRDIFRQRLSERGYACMSEFFREIIREVLK